MTWQKKTKCCLGQKKVEWCLTYLFRHSPLFSSFPEELIAADGDFLLSVSELLSNYFIKREHQNGEDLHAVQSFRFSLCKHSQPYTQAPFPLSWLRLSSLCSSSRARRSVTDSNSRSVVSRLFRIERWEKIVDKHANYTIFPLSVFFAIVILLPVDLTRVLYSPLSGLFSCFDVLSHSFSIQVELSLFSFIFILLCSLLPSFLVVNGECVWEEVIFLELCLSDCVSICVCGSFTNRKKQHLTRSYGKQYREGQSFTSHTISTLFYQEFSTHEMLCCVQR